MRWRTGREKLNGTQIGGQRRSLDVAVKLLVLLGSGPGIGSDTEGSVAHDGITSRQLEVAVEADKGGLRLLAEEAGIRRVQLKRVPLGGDLQGLVVKAVLLLGGSGKGLVGDDGDTDSGGVEVDVLEIGDVVVEGGLAGHAVDSERAPGDGDGDEFGRLLLLSLDLLPLLVEAEVGSSLIDGLALVVEEGGDPSCRAVA